MSVEHSTLGNGDTTMHGIVKKTVANAAALAALTISADDIAQKILIRQTDTNQLWVPITTAPTFQEVNVAPMASRAATALTDADTTIATTTWQRLLPNTVTASRTYTITPSTKNGRTFAIDVGTQGFDVVIKDGGPILTTYTVTAGSKERVYICSDGSDVWFTSVPLGSEPTN